MADEMLIAGTQTVPLLLVGDMFETWKGFEHGQDCTNVNTDCVSTKLLVNRDLQEFAKGHHAHFKISAYQGTAALRVLQPCKYCV